MSPEQDATRTHPPAAEEAAGEPVEAEHAELAAEPETEIEIEPEAEVGVEAEIEPEAEVEVEAEEPVVAAEPDYKDQWLRAAAELDNVRKRARRDVGAAEARGIAKLARELLPALDNFERALAAAEAQPENRDHHLTDGIRLVQTELLAALARVGIEPDSPNGERFDPHRHEALAQRPVDGAEAGTIVEVYNAGYTYGDEVLRPAKVVVAA